MKHWFGGNQDGEDMFWMMAKVAHCYDDIIDGDPVDAARAHECFSILLIELPQNKLYQKYLPIIIPLWEIVIAAYKTANSFEAEGMKQGLEISHNLRYAAGHIVALVMIGETGRDEAQKHMQEMWQVVVSERYDDYEKQHLKGA